MVRKHRGSGRGSESWVELWSAGVLHMRVTAALQPPRLSSGTGCCFACRANRSPALPGWRRRPTPLCHATHLVGELAWRAGRGRRRRCGKSRRGAWQLWHLQRRCPPCRRRLPGCQSRTLSSQFNLPLTAQTAAGSKPPTALRRQPPRRAASWVVPLLPPPLPRVGPVPGPPGSRLDGF